jgi:hypothetical protein
LFEIAALEKHIAKREMISAKIVSLGQSGEWQSFGQAFRVGFGNALEIRLDFIFCNRSLVDLDDVSFSVDEKGNRNAHIAMAVKQLAEEKIVDGDDVGRRFENGKRVAALRKFILDCFAVFHCINADREALLGGSGPA